MSASLAGLAAAAALATAVALLTPPARRIPDVGHTAAVASSDPVVGGRLRRHRLLCSLLAGIGAATVVGGPAALPTAVVATVVAWVVITRAEPPEVRRKAEQVRRDLPALVTLLASALRSGAPPAEALATVAAALPGPAAERLSTVASRLRLGDDPVTAWAELARDPDLGPLGRALSRAQMTGSSVVGAVDRLADDLARSARAAVEDKARAVGVKAAVPLGLCLLPSFVLIGIVPLAAGLLRSLAW